MTSLILDTTSDFFERMKKSEKEVDEQKKVILSLKMDILLK